MIPLTTNYELHSNTEFWYTAREEAVGLETKFCS